MDTIAFRSTLVAGTVAAMAVAGPADAQTGSREPTGRVSVYVDSVQRRPVDGIAGTNAIELSTAATIESPEALDEGSGLDFRLDFRHSRSLQGGRRERLSLYDAYVGGHVGEGVQLSVRAGHLWLQDLGTIGSLAGGLVEVGHPRSADRIRFRVGAFGGREPTLYEVGYVPDVTKVGGYAVIARGYLQRHVVGYTQVRQGAMTERSVVSVTNFLPIGRAFFLYQAAEVDVRGPAGGVAPPGLSYFVANARITPTERVEVSTMYNRGRSIDARTLANDVLNGRPLSPQATDALQYESRGGRLTVEIVRGYRAYVGYTQDRTNREDALTGRVALGGHASDIFRSGVDVSASNSRVGRPTGAYNSSFISVGRSVGRATYVSFDYSTSLSVIQFLRSDGVVIETRPWMRRYGVSANATLSRGFALLLSADVTRDETLRELRILTGLSYRIR